MVADLIAHARRAAEEAGRDPDALEITVGSPPDPARIEAWAEAGVDRVVVALPGAEHVAAFDEVIRTYA